MQRDLTGLLALAVVAGITLTTHAAHRLTPDRAGDLRGGQEGLPCTEHEVTEFGCDDCFNVGPGSYICDFNGGRYICKFYNDSFCQRCWVGIEGDCGGTLTYWANHTGCPSGQTPTSTGGACPFTYHPNAYSQSCSSDCDP